MDSLPSACQVARLCFPSLTGGLGGNALSNMGFMSCVAGAKDGCPDSRLISLHAGEGVVVKVVVDMQLVSANICPARLQVSVLCTCFLGIRPPGQGSTEGLQKGSVACFWQSPVMVSYGRICRMLSVLHCSFWSMLSVRWAPYGRGASIEGYRWK
jgi:hypothetical protein